MGWFAVHERGTAMGIRQTSQPLGVALAGLTLPTLGAAVGPFRALALPAVLCLVAAVLVLTLAPDPPRPQRPAGAEPERSPVPDVRAVAGARRQRAAGRLAVRGVGVRHRVPGPGAGLARRRGGRLRRVRQVAGAAGRIATGVWSDRVGSRLRPMRQVAVAATLVLLLFALGDAVAGWLAVTMLAVGAVVTVAPNGLAFTSTAEIAGPAWSGRALGVQNTGQNAVASVVPAALGLLVGTTGYAAAFAIAAVAPLAAVLVTPVREERRRQGDGV